MERKWNHGRDGNGTQRMEPLRKVKLTGTEKKIKR